MVFSVEGFLEVAIESWPEWDMNPRPLNPVLWFALKNIEMNIDWVTNYHWNILIIASVPTSSPKRSFPLFLTLLPFHICCLAIYLSRFVVPHSNTSKLLFRILPPRIHCSAFYHSGFATPCFTVPDLLFRIPCSSVLCFTTTFQSLLIKYSENIKGHKGQNSTGSWCCGFLVLESQCRGFLVLESRCQGFLSSEKTPCNHDFLAYLSSLLYVVVF